MAVIDRNLTFSDLLDYAEVSKHKLRPYNFLVGPSKSILKISTKIDAQSPLQLYVSALTDANTTVNCLFKWDSSEVYSAINSGNEQVELISLVPASDGIDIYIQISNNWSRGEVNAIGGTNNLSDDLPVYNSIILVEDANSIPGNAYFTTDHIASPSYSSDSANFTIKDASGNNVNYTFGQQFTNIESAGKLYEGRTITIESDTLSGGEAVNENTDNTLIDFSTNVTIPLELKEINSDDIDYAGGISVDVYGRVTLDDTKKAASDNNYGFIKTGYSGDGAVKLDNEGNAYVLLEGSDVHRYTEMPLANLHLNKIYQYIGTTSADYINGYFYKSVQYPLRVASFSQEGLYYFDNGVTSAKKLLDNNYRRNSLLTDTGNPILWTISAYNIASINASTVVGDITFTLTDSLGIYEYRLSYDDLADWGISISKAATDTIGDKLNKLTQTISMSLSSSWHWELWNTQPAVANWNGVDITFITNLEIDNMMGTLANY